ncbi:hypothetical protein C2L64_09255 [Paraburkholderia hospita]|uniref:Uncharacterized protein n=1 Tax=Paraburkholderia hospita TaxID=169430 RepID=A0AAN1J788_9BURK|nr:hypothetical protein C2L64_09255 [Paraburkholderia hospita]
MAGRWTVRNAVDGAGMGGRKKRMPGCNGPDRGWDITPRESGQTSVWSTVARWLTDLDALVDTGVRARESYMDDMWAHAATFVQLLFPSGVCLPRWGRCAFCCGNDQPKVGEQHESIRPTGWICAFPRA